jgi:osmoprotectant transport system permease protein
VQADFATKKLFDAGAVTITGCALGFASLFFSWLVIKPNRLTTGAGISVTDSLGFTLAILVAVLWVSCLLTGFMRSQAKKPFVLAIVANLILIITFLAIGLTANKLTGASSPSSRISPGAGVWTTVIAVYVILHVAQNKVNNRLLKSLIILPGVIAIFTMILTGYLNNLSIMQELLVQKDRFLQELLHHLYLVLVSVIAGTLIGFSFGVLATRNKTARAPIFFITNIAQTIPALALFGLLIAPLSALSFAVPTLRNFGVNGIGDAPALIALTIYSLLPIVQNTCTGLEQVDKSAMEAGKGMGMNRWQLFFAVELPLSAPVIMEGIRIASVQGVGLAALAALIGAGGLGWFVFQGLGQAAPDLILLGAIPIILLALLVDLLMSFLTRLTIPKYLLKNV